MLLVLTVALCIGTDSRDTHAWDSGYRRRGEHRWIVSTPWLTCRKRRDRNSHRSNIEKEDDRKRGRWRRRTKGRRGRRHRPRRTRLDGPQMGWMIARRVVYVVMSAMCRIRVGAKACGACCRGRLVRCVRLARSER